MPCTQRTPRPPRRCGRVFSMALSGAGIRGGQVIGASDKNGAYPTTDLVQGGDLTATIFHRLGIDPNGMFRAVSGMLTVPRTTARSAAVRLRSVKLEFGADPRDEYNTPA